MVEEGLADKAVLINPAVEPHPLFEARVGMPQKHYYSEEIYTPAAADAALLRDLDKSDIALPERYAVLLQEGDEVLDYRRAAARYSACQPVVEAGGNHSFTGYERYLPAIMRFFLFDERVDIIP